MDLLQNYDILVGQNDFDGPEIKKVHITTAAVIRSQLPSASRAVGPSHPGLADKTMYPHSMSWWLRPRSALGHGSTWLPLPASMTSVPTDL